MHGRPPKSPLFPVNIFKHELDMSDPFTFLYLKRGILRALPFLLMTITPDSHVEYVQLKPILAIVTMILKAVGKYNEGNFKATSGYLYIAIVYNISICVALWSLAMFWVCINDDIKAFRPMPKFLCVKGILFFSFWQSIFISILVSSGLIKKLGPYTDIEHISVGLTDLLVCLEMPIFAVAHMYAFAASDFIDKHLHYVARMPMLYAFKDAFGIKDVVEDSRATFRGEGVNYRAFEPSEGFLHQGSGRENRIKAGLRYSKGGKKKYWLPLPADGLAAPGKLERGVNNAIERVGGHGEEVHAPLLEVEADDVVHLAPDLQHDGPSDDPEWDWHFGEGSGEVGFELPFGEADPKDEKLYAECKRYLFGDYNYPNIDVSSEMARGQIWDDEERVLRDERGAWVRDGKGYGAIGVHPYPRFDVSSASSRGGGGNGKGRERNEDHFGPTMSERERQVDYEQDRTPADGESGDFRLKWTNVRRAGESSRSRPSSALSSPKLGVAVGRERKRSLLASPASAASSPGSSAGGRMRGSPPTPSTDRPLPPDAVDLVVEDPNATHEEQERERRRGEPAIGGSGLRKVFRRGFEVPHPDGGVTQGEIQVAEEEAEWSGDKDVVAGHHIKGDVAEMNKEEQVMGEVEGTVATAETPPAHARVFEVGEDDDNPWA